VSGTSSDNLESVKKMLLKRKVELEEKLTQLSKEKVTDDQIQDPGDQALTSTMETLKLSFQDTEREEYDRILSALKKIEEGTYGICIDCGQPISEKRLKTNPNVARCLICQEAFEENPEQ
jgi:DnaK suppressor protein